MSPTRAPSALCAAGAALILCAARLALAQPPAPSPPAAPAIQVSHLSPFGARPGSLGGRVRNVDPARHRLAPLIFITGMGWFSRPSCASTTVPLDSQGSFAVTFTTSGVDERAERIALFAVPAETAVPCRLNAPGVPEDLERQAVAQLVLLRPDPDQRSVRFAGEDWLVKSVPVPVGPGPNLFSPSEQSVFVDADGRLHLRVRRENRQWLSSEVYSRRAFGYGTYTVVLASPPHRDPNVILGMFTWADAERAGREIDLLEIGKFGNPQQSSNAQTVVQPFDLPGHMHRFRLPETAPTTHRMTWEPARVLFQSFLGETTDESAKIHEFTFTGQVPKPDTPNLTFRFNLWMFDNRPPVDGRAVEAVIKSFRYEPLAGAAPFPLLGAVVDPASCLPDVAAGEIAAAFGTELTPSRPTSAACLLASISSGWRRPCSPSAKPTSKSLRCRPVPTTWPSASAEPLPPCHIAVAGS